MVGTRKCESRKVTFGVQTLNGNVKNIQAYIVDSILKLIPYLVNNGNKKLEKGKWGKPDVLLGVEGIADLIICNSMKQSPGEIVMETEVGVPWKNQEISPAKGYGLAQGRLRSTIRRLKKSPELLEHYDEYFKNLLEEGVIEK
ncbi:unnamed protein product, partial [Onchocerca ochengi]|uniref:Ribonuclease III n=1 Tax=Onchocerca ochengi TaxID=42157 RepID=A0A182ETV0_ONCOC